MALRSLSLADALDSEAIHNSQLSHAIGKKMGRIAHNLAAAFLRPWLRNAAVRGGCLNSILVGKQCGHQSESISQTRGRRRKTSLTLHLLGGGLFHIVHVMGDEE